jgi:hypothetical protein
MEYIVKYTKKSNCDNTLKKSSTSSNIEYFENLCEALKQCENLKNDSQVTKISCHTIQKFK